MESRRLIEALVTRETPNATVVDVVEQAAGFAVTIAGTTGVVARCEVPRDVVERAGRGDEAAADLAAMLKRCADSTVASIPDGRS